MPFEYFSKNTTSFQKKLCYTVTMTNIPDDLDEEKNTTNNQTDVTLTENNTENNPVAEEQNHNIDTDTSNEKVDTQNLETNENSNNIDENEQKPEPTDIFLWANHADRYKDELNIDLFVFSKGYTVFATQYSDQLKQQLKVLFLYDMLAEIQTGAATGLRVRELENAESEDDVLQRTSLENVVHAQEVIEQIKYNENQLEIFSEGEHEFKKIKGIVAKFTTPKGQEFFCAKVLPQAQVLKGANAWVFSEGSFKQFEADAGLKITPDNQVLITGEDVFVFNESKFEKLFEYDAKKFAVAEEKIKEIEQFFTFSFADGLNFSMLLKDKKSLVTKLLKANPQLTTQEKLLEHAEEMGLELMQDPNGAIIIMDAGHAMTFVELLADDYLESNMTGIRYKASSKKNLTQSDDDNTNDPLLEIANK